MKALSAQCTPSIPTTRQSDLVVKYPTSDGFASVLNGRELQQVAAWKQVFTASRKDHRYYEIVQQTINPEFEYAYFLVEDSSGQVRGVQPFFVLRQDLLQGAGARLLKVVGTIRKLFPRFLTMRTLMVGCAAGEGQLAAVRDEDHPLLVAQLAEVLERYARQARVSVVVLKEFPSSCRASLSTFGNKGYTRVPSLPSVRIHLPFKDFEQFMTQALSKATRKDLRRKFRDAQGAGISMEVHADITSIVDELHPLYLQVFERSPLHFEKLTKEFLRKLGQEMPDKVRFFVWRRQGRAIAFSLCMLSGDELHDEYVGLDYSVALDLHLYFYTLRDVMQWAMANGYKWYCSSGQGYEPKLRLKAELAPLDLYVRHTWPGANFIMRRVLPLIEPTRGNAVLQQFPNFDDLWGKR